MSLCSLGWPRIHGNHHPSSSPKLGLQACTPQLVKRRFYTLLTCPWAGLLHIGLSLDEEWGGDHKELKRLMPCWTDDKELCPSPSAPPSHCHTCSPSKQSVTLEDMGLAKELALKGTHQNDRLTSVSAQSQ